MTAKLILFKEDDESVPVEEWLKDLPPKGRDRMLAKMKLLRDNGHKLQRPHADVLRDGIYELRAKYERLNLRILYFFYAQQAVVLSHGFAKQQSKVPDREISLALDRKQRFLDDPDRHAK